MNCQRLWRWQHRGTQSTQALDDRNPQTTIQCRQLWKACRRCWTT